jgi:ABC-2 type transport system permease protein/sodium transport system permease protein
LGLTTSTWLSVVAAGVFGLSLWPIAHEIFLFSERIGLSVLGTDQISVAQTMLNQLAGVPLWLILLTLALVPAVFEELSFRGFLFGSLRAVMPGWWAVASAAILFGVFHEALFPGRLLTSTFLGVVLGWVRLSTLSVVPCMVLHAVHNGLLLTVAHWRDELIAYGLGIEQQEYLPRSWLALAALGVLVGSVIMIAASPNSTAQHAEEPAARRLQNS